MPIKKFEPVTINKVTRSVNALGDNTETLAVWFIGRAVIHDIKNPLRLKEFYRQYTSFTNMTFPYTPNIFAIAQANSAYSFNWRTYDWRIIDAVENGRESITFLTYDANSTVAV